MKETIIKSYIEERDLLVSDIYANTSWIIWSKKVARLEFLDSILLKYLDKQPTETKQPEPTERNTGMEKKSVIIDGTKQ